MDVGQELLAFGIGLGVAVVALAFSANVVDTTDNGFTANSFAANISRDGQTGLGNLSAQTPTIGTVAGISLVLFLLIRVGLMVKGGA